jgi:hypothetical protein
MRRCTECGGALVARHGDVVEKLALVGPVTIRDIEYEECAKCGDRLLAAEAGEAWDEAVAARETELVGGLAEKDFLSAAEAMRMLHMSRQAFHKNGRIRRGFIYSVPAGAGRRRYHRRSVELFRDTGDGRFPLPGSEIDAEVSICVSPSVVGRWFVTAVPGRVWQMAATAFRSEPSCHMEVCR